jgi:S1-C subfamily serine protease
MSCIHSVDNISLKQKYDYLQNISVTVISEDRYFGSGILIFRGEDVYVLTSGHVIDDASTIKIIDGDPENDGIPNVEIKFNKINVFQRRTKDNDGIVMTESIADVVKYSPSYESDLALLKIRPDYVENYEKERTQFYLEEDISGVLTPVYHVGSITGIEGANSFSEGIISRINVIVDRKLYDQTTTVVYPGSSGGGIFEQNSLEYIGMIAAAVGPAYNYMIPVRNIKSWMEKEDIIWIIDYSKEEKVLESESFIRNMNIFMFIEALSE